MTTATASARALRHSESTRRLQAYHLRRSRLAARARRAAEARSAERAAARREMFARLAEMLFGRFTPTPEAAMTFAPMFYRSAR